MKSSHLKIDDTGDLRTFMIDLKSWAQDQRETLILARIQKAEQRGSSASELLLEYVSALKDIREKFWNRLPENFRSSVERGILVASDAVNLGSYTYKKS